MTSGPEKVKVVLTGAPSVGKTSLANRYTRNIFSNRYINTLGCDFYIKTVFLDEFSEMYKLIIIDIGGQVEIKKARQKYMKDSDIVLVVFSLEEFDGEIIHEYLDDVKLLDNDPVSILVGNKSDLVDLDKMDLSVPRGICEEIGMPFYITSAKENKGVRDLFTKALVRYVNSQ